MIIPLYVISSIIAIIIFSGVSILLKYLIPQSGGPVQFTFIQFTISFTLHIFVIIIYSSFFNPLYDIDFNQLLLIFLATLFGFLGYLSYMAGLNKGTASLGGVILSSRVFISIPIALILFNETYIPSIYFSILLALIGSIIVSWDDKQSIGSIIKLRAPGIRYFFAAAFLWVFQNLIIRDLNNSIDLILFLTIRMGFFFLFSTIFIYFYLNITNNSFYFPERKTISGIILYGVLSLIAQLGLVYALGENLLITETIGAFEGTLTFVFAILFANFIKNDFLNEPLSSKIILTRFFGVILSFIGTFLTILWV